MEEDEGIGPLFAYGLQPKTSFCIGGEGKADCGQGRMALKDGQLVWDHQPGNKPPVLPDNSYSLIFLTFFRRGVNLKSLVIGTAEEHPES